MKMIIKKPVVPPATFVTSSVDQRELDDKLMLEAGEVKTKTRALNLDIPEPTICRGRFIIELDPPSGWHIGQLVTSPEATADYSTPEPAISTVTSPEATADYSTSEPAVSTVTSPEATIDYSTSTAEPSTPLPSYYESYPTPRLLLVEHYQLSTYLGEYGLGRTLSTFSLLPGEKTKIKISSYKRSTETRREASSILDSSDDQVEKRFEDTITQEQSLRLGAKTAFAYHAEAEVKGQASWGWGSASASVSGGVKGSADREHDEFAKNMSNAIYHHAARASSQREIHIDTSLDIQIEEGHAEAVTRTIENINVGRTLNFLFQQMSQEYITFLHLIDIRVAFFDGTEGSAHEVPLYQMDDLLNQYVAASCRNEVRNRIRQVLNGIRDLNGKVHNIKKDEFIVEYVEKDENNEERRTLAVDPKYRTTLGLFKIPGLVISETTNVMRTDGVVVEALLGMNNGLDVYSQSLQEQAIRKEQLENERNALALEIIRNKDVERADIFQKLYPSKLNPSIGAITISTPDS